MANIFKNSITGSVGTSPVVVYTTPNGSTSTIIGINISNIVTNNINVDVQLQDSSASETRYVVKNSLIIPGSSLILVGGDQKLVLESLDSVIVTSSEAGSADVVTSLLEIT